jgi:hypothetical protein
MDPITPQGKIGDGAASQGSADSLRSSEYPIRALVRASAILMGPNMRGEVLNWRREGLNYKSEPDARGFSWLAYESEIAIDPTPEQVAEERAKAGLPPEAAQVMDLDALLADYGLAFQHAGWDWRVKLDAAKAKIIEWVARSQSPAALPAEAAPRPADASEAEPSSLIRDLADALRYMTGLVNDAGGPVKLSRGVDLGQTSWAIKMDNALIMAGNALSRVEG